MNSNKVERRQTNPLTYLTLFDFFWLRSAPLEFSWLHQILFRFRLLSALYRFMVHSASFGFGLLLSASFVFILIQFICLLSSSISVELIQYESYNFYFIHHAKEFLRRNNLAVVAVSLAKIIKISVNHWQKITHHIDKC